ncbi:hypothetical protein [Halosimplex halophilum]|uniref:hypothetical protein n=1 Tax=Halosimplex halophilum TaxID=2559572 RepID=UPI00107FBC36|nr:hypothetical protein [Halosimplex halophilum]
MTEPNQAAVEEAVREGESMGGRDLVELIERHHDGAGVERGTIEAYAEELAARDDYAFDRQAFLADVDEHTTDADRWEGGGYYEIGDAVDDHRISLFPELWHEELGGSTDAAEYVRFIQDEEPEYLADLELGGPGEGVPKPALLQALELVGRVDRPTAREALAAAGDRGDIVQDADQNPDADIYLADRVSEDTA